MKVRFPVVFRAAFAAALLMLMLMFNIQILSAQEPPAVPTVPDVTGMNVPQAAAALNLVGMALGNEIHALRPPESAVPVDTITQQSVAAGTPVTAGQAVDVTILHDPNVTLIYDDNDLTMINRASSRINLDEVTFNSVQAAQPAFFHAARWSGRVGAGNCTQVWAVNRGSSKSVAGCGSIERWMTTNNRAEHFWTTTSGVQTFNVVQAGIERAICEAAPPGSEAQPRTCELYLEPAGTSNDLNAGFVYFAYTTDKFLIMNRTTDKWMRLNRSILHIINPADGVGRAYFDLGDANTFGNPQIVAVLQRPAPGQCLLYVRGGTEDYTPPQPCHVIAVRPFEAKVFWDYPFELESVDDGKRRLCTAAVPDKLTICILPR